MLDKALTRISSVLNHARLRRAPGRDPVPTNDATEKVFHGGAREAGMGRGAPGWS